MDDIIFDPILGELRTAFELERIVKEIEIRGGGGGGGSSISTTDELPEGITNLYSQWENNTYSALDFLQPKTTTRGLIIGNDLHSSLLAAFAGSSAFFNGDVAGVNNGVNYFVNASYGVSGLPLGGVFLAGRARGTNSVPTQTLTNDYLGGLVFTGYTNTDTWGVSGATHTIPGLYAAAATNAVANATEMNIWLGGLLTKMIGFETDTNAIIFNEAQLDSDISFYYDTGVAMFIQGSDGKIGMGTSTINASAELQLNGDLYFTKEAARTIKLEDTTTAATAGAALSILGANGSATTSGAGGAITITSGSAQAGNSSGGAVNIAGGISSGIGTGGHVNIDAGDGFVDGNVRLVSSKGKVGIGQTTTPSGMLHVFGKIASTPTLVVDNGAITASIAEFYDNASLVWSIADGGALTAGEGINMIFGTSTGTKIGTATTQKIGFWNATPVIQQTGDVKTALQTLGIVASATYPTASTTATGDVELAITSEVNTGTDADRAVTPDALAGSYAGTKSMSIMVTDVTTDVTTGDGKAYFTVPSSMNGMDLVRAQATVVTAGTTNATTVMIRNKTQAADMLSGAISIASAGTVGTVGTIDTANDDVATDDVIGIDVDSVSTTAPKGLMVILEFRLP